MIRPPRRIARVAIANDDRLTAEALRRIVADSPDYQLAWIAPDGEEAVRMAREDRPDVLLMDLMMPRLNGIEATRRIMAESPCAIVIVTASVASNAGEVFAAMGAGALDVVAIAEKGGVEALAAAVRAKLRTASAMSDGRRLTPVPPAPVLLVALGASAGGPQAIVEVLKGLDTAMPMSIVIAQHIDARFAPSMSDWFNGQSKLEVRIAAPGDRPEKGKVFVAGRDAHLVLDPDGMLQYRNEPRETPYRPSVDVLFESVARHWSGPKAGVLLTGMGRDGAVGLGALRRAGARTVAQDQATSAVFGMPAAAAQLGAATDVLPLGSIAPFLRRLSLEPRSS